MRLVERHAAGRTQAGLFTQNDPEKKLARRGRDRTGTSLILTSACHALLPQRFGFTVTNVSSMLLPAAFVFGLRSS